MPRTFAYVRSRSACDRSCTVGVGNVSILSKSGNTTNIITSTNSSSIVAVSNIYMITVSKNASNTSFMPANSTRITTVGNSSIFGTSNHSANRTVTCNRSTCQPNITNRTIAKPK